MYLNHKRIPRIKENEIFYIDQFMCHNHVFKLKHLDELKKSNYQPSEARMSLKFFNDLSSYAETLIHEI